MSMACGILPGYLAGNRGYPCQRQLSMAGTSVNRGRWPCIQGGTRVDGVRHTTLRVAADTRASGTCQERVPMSMAGVVYAYYSSGTRVNGAGVGYAGVGYAGYPVHRVKWHSLGYGYQWRRVSAMRGTRYQCCGIHGVSAYRVLMGTYGTRGGGINRVSAYPGILTF